MFLTQKVLKLFNKTRQINFIKCYSTVFNNIIENVLTVQTFCNVHIDIPYKVKIKPLDVHQYHNCDILKIKCPKEASIKYFHDGSNIKIYSDKNESDENLWCAIKAPIKANIDVKAQGNIKVGFFNGDLLNVLTKNGDIFVDKFQGDTIKLITDNGNIILKGVIQASDIEAKVLENGSITTERLQGLRLHLQTSQGNITTLSSYCDVSCFEAVNGFLQLANAHKNCLITIKNNGNLSLGFDGRLEANLVNTCADIQLSRILDDSVISMKDNGRLILRISDDCQKHTFFKINSQDITMDHNIKSIAKEINGQLTLTPPFHQQKHFHVDCEQSSVEIHSSSWKEMLKLKFSSFSE